MKNRNFNKWRLVAIALILANHSPLGAVEFANIEAEQIDTGNTPESVVFTVGAGSSSGFVIEGGNRGDIDVSFGFENDVDSGILFSSVAQNGRDNSATGDPGGISYAISGVEFSGGARSGKFYIPLFATAGSALNSGSEVNQNVSAAFFPFAEGWIGGTAKNSSNNAAMSSVQSGNDLAENRVLLDTHFTDLASPNGQYALDLSAFGYDSSEGVLLTCGGKNENNFALSRANADGTFSLFVKDVASNGTGGENDPIAFVFIPTSAVGSHRLVASGRVNQDASTDVTGGTFSVTKGGTGEWFLTIPGQSGTTGTLLVSPCRGEDTDETVDNFVTSEWDASNSRWVVQSRDIPGSTLEDAPLSGTDIFEFAFFSSTVAANAPTAAIVSPADGSDVEFGSVTNVTTTAGSEVSKIRFGLDGEFLSEDLIGPFEAQFTADKYGPINLGISASDAAGVRSGSANTVFVVPPAGQGARFFNGKESHVNLGDPAALRLDNFTIECWFKPEPGGTATSTGAGGVTGIPLISKGRGENDSPTFNCNYFLGIDPTTRTLVGDFEDDTAGVNYPVAGTTPIIEGQWQHAALTWNGTELVLYLNGNFEASVTPTTTVNPSSDSIQAAAIGTSFDSLGVAAGNFLGAIDEVRFWNVGRTGSEILADINFQLTSDQPGMVARFDMDETSGTTISSDTGGNTIAGNIVQSLVPVAGNPFSGSRPPVVSFDSPPTGVQPVRTNFTLNATATDTGGSVTKVEFFVNGESIGVDTTAPYSVIWQRPTLGTYQLTVAATDNDGEVAQTAPVEVSIQISPAPVYASFQNGVGGYEGTFDMALGQLFATGVDSKTLGADVAQYFLDGDNGTNSPDINGFVRFADILGNAAGQIPLGATILRAEFTITTSTASSAADSPGPWIVDRILPGNPITADTNYSDNDSLGAPFRGLRSISTIAEGGLANAGGFGRIAVGQVVRNDITPAVQAWADGDANEGLMIADYYTSNGWQICTTGNPDPAKRPKLEVWYTLDSPTTYVFEATQSLFSDTAGPNVDGSTITDTQFLDMNSTDKQEALIGFGNIFGTDPGQVPPDSVIRQAYFKVTTNVGSNHQSGGPWNVHEIIQPWDVSSDYGTTGLVVGEQISAPINSWVGLGLQSTSVTDITPNILAIQDGAQRFGFAITPDTTDGWGMFWPGSELGTVVAPKLVIIASSGSVGTGDGFEAWAISKGVPLNENNDDDLDGIPALVEYALGLDPDKFDQLPGLLPSGENFSITFDKGATAASDPKITYVIETTTTLAPNDWMPANLMVENGASIMATLPKDQDRMFVRLRVIRN